MSSSRECRFRSRLLLSCDFVHKERKSKKRRELIKRAPVILLLVGGANIGLAVVDPTIRRSRQILGRVLPQNYASINDYTGGI